MRCRVLQISCCVPGVLLAICCTARGQTVSVYGTFTEVRSSNVQVSSSGSTADGWSPNFGGGVTFNFLNLHVVKLGLDARGGAGSGTTKTDTAEVSLRAGFQPPVINLKPFVQLGVGYAAATVPIVSGVGSTLTRKYITVGGHAGLDRSILPFLDWRIIDLGIAHGTSVGPTFTTDGPSNGANFFSLGTGLVAHF